MSKQFLALESIRYRKMNETSKLLILNDQNIKSVNIVTARNVEHLTKLCRAA